MIIGRTRKGIEKVGSDCLLTKRRYFQISHLARDFLLKNNVKTLPLSLNSLIKNNGWKVIAYSKLKTLNIKKYNALMRKNLGFAETHEKGVYFIYFNDEVEIGVQRFTVAHEIGHIILHHLQLPVENREQEANMFAARILMPMCVLYECKISSPKELMELCKVSFTTAKFRFQRLELLNKRKKYYTDENEIKLFENFKPFIENYKKHIKNY